jgi:hypothetical protein
MPRKVKVEVTSSDIKAKVIELIQSLSTIVNIEIENEVIDRQIDPEDIFHMSYLGKGVTIKIHGKR